MTDVSKDNNDSKISISLEMNEYSGAYPLSDPPTGVDSDYQSRGGKIIAGTPDLFMSLVNNRIDLYDNETMEKIEGIASSISGGQLIDPPTLYVDGGQVVNHNGKYRAEASRIIGIEHIPILIQDVNDKPVESLKSLKKEVSSERVNTNDFKLVDVELPLIDLENPGKGRFNSVRQIIATISRKEETNLSREETLSSELRLRDKSNESGLGVEEMRELLSTNLENSLPEIKRLNDFLQTDEAKEAYKNEKARTSMISFGNDLAY